MATSDRQKLLDARDALAAYRRVLHLLMLGAALSGATAIAGCVYAAWGLVYHMTVLPLAVAMIALGVLGMIGFCLLAGRLESQRDDWLPAPDNGVT